MPDSHVVVLGQLANDPLASEAADAAFLLASERIGSGIVHAMNVGVRHDCFYAEYGANAPLLAESEHTA